MSAPTVRFLSPSISLTPPAVDTRVMAPGPLRDMMGGDEAARAADKADEYAAMQRVEAERILALHEQEQQRRRNAVLGADFRGRGVEHYTDAYGNIQARRDEAGNELLQDLEGKMDWDATTGQAFRMVRTGGETRQQFVDENAFIGADPRDPHGKYIYRQNTQSPWETIDAEAGLLHEEEAVRKASAEHLRRQAVAAKERKLGELRIAGAEAQAVPDPEARFVDWEKEKGLAERELSGLKDMPAEEYGRSVLTKRMEKEPQAEASRRRDFNSQRAEGLNARHAALQRENEALHADETALKKRMAQGTTLEEGTALAAQGAALAGRRAELNAKVEAHRQDAERFNAWRKQNQAAALLSYAGNKIVKAAEGAWKRLFSGKGGGEEAAPAAPAPVLNDRLRAMEKERDEAVAAGDDHRAGEVAGKITEFVKQNRSALQQERTAVATAKSSDKTKIPIPKEIEALRNRPEWKGLPAAERIQTLNSAQTETASRALQADSSGYGDKVQDIERNYASARLEEVKSGLAEDLASGALTDKQVEAYMKGGLGALEDDGEAARYLHYRYGTDAEVLGPWVTQKVSLEGADGKSAGFAYVRHKPGDESHVQVSWTVIGNDRKQIKGTEEVEVAKRLRFLRQDREMSEFKKKMAEEWARTGTGWVPNDSPSPELAEARKILDLSPNRQIAVLAQQEISKSLQNRREIVSKMGQGFWVGLPGQAAKGFLNLGAAVVHGPGALTGSKESVENWRQGTADIDGFFEGQSRLGFEGGTWNNVLKAISEEAIPMALSMGTSATASAARKGVTSLVERSFMTRMATMGAEGAAKGGARQALGQSLSRGLFGKWLGTAELEGALARKLADRVTNAVAFFPSSMRSGLQNISETLDKAEELRAQGKDAEAKELEDRAVMNGWAGVAIETLSENLWLNEMLVTRAGRSFTRVATGVLTRRLGVKRMAALTQRAKAALTEAVKAGAQEGVEEIVAGVGNRAWMNEFAAQNKDLLEGVEVEFLSGALLGAVMGGAKALARDGKPEVLQELMLRGLEGDPKAMEALADIRARAERISGQPGDLLASTEARLQTAVNSAPMDAPVGVGVRTAQEALTGLQNDYAAAEQSGDKARAQSILGMLQQATAAVTTAVESHRRQVGEAKVEMAAIADPAARTRAEAVLRIAAGAETSSLTSGEIRALGVERNGNSLTPAKGATPAVEQGPGGGLIITDDAIAELESLAPSSKGLIQMDERTARMKDAERGTNPPGTAAAAAAGGPAILTPSAAPAGPEAAPRGAANTAAGAEVDAGEQSGPAGRAGTPEPPRYSVKVAAPDGTEHTVEVTAPHEAAARARVEAGGAGTVRGVTEISGVPAGGNGVRVEDAGAHVAAGEPSHGAGRSGDSSSQPPHETKPPGDFVRALVPALRGLRRAGPVLQRAVQTFRALQSVFTGGVVVVPASKGGGLSVEMSAQGPVLVIGTETLREQLAELEQKRRDAAGWVERVILEEAIHAAALALEQQGHLNAAELWNELPARVQEMVRQNYGDGDAWNLGHEFLRMVLQKRLQIKDGRLVSADGTLSEEMQGSLLSKLLGALRALRSYLTNLAKNLRRDGSRPEVIRQVEAAAGNIEGLLRTMMAAGAGVPVTGTHSGSAAGGVLHSKAMTPQSLLRELKPPTAAEAMALGQALLKESEKPGMFQYHNSKSKDLHRVLGDFGVEATLTERPDFYNEHTDERTGMIEIRHVKRAGVIKVKDALRSDVRVDSFGSDKLGAELTSAMYQAIYTWVLNNGKRVVPDYEYTPDGAFRRISQMLSSILRHHTTRHLVPHGLVKRWFSGGEGKNDPQLAATVGGFVYMEAILALQQLAETGNNPYGRKISKDAGDEAVSNADLPARTAAATAAAEERLHPRVGEATADRALWTALSLRTFRTPPDGKRVLGLLGKGAAERAAAPPLRLRSLYSAGLKKKGADPDKTSPPAKSAGLYSRPETLQEAARELATPPTPAEAEALGRALLEERDQPDRFQFGHSESTDFSQVMKDFGMEAVVRENPGYINPRTGERTGSLEIHAPHGKEGLVVIADTGLRDVRINSVNAGHFQGAHSSALYQAAYTWALNNGKRVAPDHSYEKAGEYRRISHMISSILRHLTARHLLPHRLVQDSFKGGDGKNDPRLSATLGGLLYTEATLSLKRLQKAGMNPLVGSAEAGIAAPAADPSAPGKKPHPRVGPSTAGRLLWTAQALQAVRAAAHAGTTEAGPAPADMPPLPPRSLYSSGLNRGQKQKGAGPDTTNAASRSTRPGGIAVQPNAPPEPDTVRNAHRVREKILAMASPTPAQHQLLERAEQSVSQATNVPVSGTSKSGTTAEGTKVTAATAKPDIVPGEGPPPLTESWVATEERSRSAAEALHFDSPVLLTTLEALAKLINGKGLPGFHVKDLFSGGPVQPGWERPEIGWVLPSPEKGGWDGEPGNSGWHSHDPEVNLLTDDKPIQFRDGRIDLSPYTILQYVFNSLTGKRSDFGPADKKLAGILGVKNAKAAAKWRRQLGLTWHHHQDGRTLQLVPSILNRIAHIGGAAKKRSEK